MRFRSEEQRRAVMARLAYARGVKKEKSSRKFQLRSGQQQHIMGLPSGNFKPAEYRKIYHKHRATTKRRVDYFNVNGNMMPRIPAEIQRERIQAVARYHMKKTGPILAMTPAELRKDLYHRAVIAQKDYLQNFQPGRKKFRPGTAVRKVVKDRLHQLKQSQTV